MLSKLMAAPDEPLASQNVLVVGGASGIGRGIARAFANEGCRVAICGRNQDKLDEAVADANTEVAPTFPVLSQQCDVSDRLQVADLFSWFATEYGDLDILAYCAGINVPNRTFADLEPEDFDDVLKINTTGAFNCLHAALPGMRERKAGLIFNVVSLAGIQTTQVAGVPYAASKVAQASLGTFANLEALPDGVRITNVYPGDTNTALLDERPEPPSKEAREAMVHPEDIAALLVAVAKLPARANVPEIVITPVHMPRL